MDKKKFILISLGLILLSSSPSFGGVSAMYKDWDFVEYKFVYKIAKKMDKPNQFLDISWRTGLAAVPLLGVNVIAKIEKRPVDWKNLLRNDIIRATATFMFSYPWLGVYILSHYKAYLHYKAMKNLLAKWPTYRQYTPEGLHQSLDELHAKYGNYVESLPRKKALRFVEIILREVQKRRTN